MRSPSPYEEQRLRAHHGLFLSPAPFPGGSDYTIVKHAINRFVELLVIEYTTVKAFALHSGIIDTKLASKVGVEFEKLEKTDLPADSDSLPQPREIEQKDSNKLYRGGEPGACA